MANMTQKNTIFVVDKQTSNGYCYHFVKMATGIIKTYFYKYGDPEHKTEILYYNLDTGTIQEAGYHMYYMDIKQIASSWLKKHFGRMTTKEKNSFDKRYVVTEYNVLI